MCNCEGDLRYTAEELREKVEASQKIKVWSYEEIIKRCNELAEDGIMKFCEKGGYISPETKDKLEKDGFCVVIWSHPFSKERKFAVSFDLF